MAKGYVGAPTYYTPLDYIESTGTQHINTGFNPSRNTGVEMDFIPYNDIGYSDYGYYFGASDGTNRYSLNTYPTFSGGELYLNGGYNPYLTKNTRKQITIRNQTFSDDSGHSFSVSGTAFQVSKPLYLFCNNNNGSASSKGKMRLYSFKLYDGDTLVRDYVPAKDINNVVCLYDKVSGEFYYNAGTGTFTAGTEGTPIYLGEKARRIKKAYVGINTVARKITKGYVGVNSLIYTPLDYIESTGTQYIDTGLSISNGFHVKVDISFADFSAAKAITGCYNNDPQRFVLRTNTDSTVVTHFGGYSGNNLITGPVLTANTRYLIEAEMFNGTQSLSVDSVSYGTRTITGQTFPNVNLFLLAIWSSGSAQNFVSGKLYGAKYYDSNNNLLRDFIPALDGNNVAGLYDLVEKKFYKNAGTGTFSYGTAGTPVYADVARLCYSEVPYPLVNYIESTGTQYINTGYKPKTSTKFKFKFRLSGSSVSISYERIYDAFSGSNSDGKLQRSGTSNTWGLQVGYNGGRSITLNQETDYELEVSNHNVIINGVESTFTAVTYASNYNLSIFHGNDRNGKFKLYYFQIYEDNTLVKDFVPVLNNSNVPCLYDKVSEQLYTNAGSGTFLYG